MAGTCSHKRSREVNRSVNSKNFGWITYIVELKCDECSKTFGRKEVRGKLTGWKYKESNISRETCNHAHYTVDESTQEIIREQTLLRTFFLLIIGPSANGVQYNEYLVAHAKCNLCDFLFYMRAGYELKLKNGKTTNCRTTEWKPLTTVKNGVKSHVPVKHYAAVDKF